MHTLMEGNRAADYLAAQGRTSEVWSLEILEEPIETSGKILERYKGKGQFNDSQEWASDHISCLLLYSNGPQFLFRQYNMGFSGFFMEILLCFVL